MLPDYDWSIDVTGGQSFLYWMPCDISSCRFAGCNHNKWLNLWGAQRRRERTQWDHPSLCSGLIDHAWGWEKIDCHFPQRRDVLMLDWKLWQQAKQQQGLRQGLSLLSLNLVVPTTLRSSSDSQLSSVLWSCTNPMERGFCSCLALALLLETWTLHHCYHQLCLQLGVFEPDISRVLRTFAAMLFPAVVPQLPACLLLDSWDTEQSLLGFLRNDCCFLNNLEQAWKARSSEGQRHSLRKIW